MRGSRTEASETMRPSRVAFVWMVLAVLAYLPCAAQNPDDSLDWEALRKGEVIIQDAKTAAGVPGLRAYFLVTATRQAVWSMLLDYENFQAIFEGIEDMEVLEEDERGAMVAFRVDAVLKELRYVLYRHYTEPGHRLTWTRVSGDLESIEGSWQVLDTDDPETKLLVYESYVDIGFSLITWLIREGAKKKTVAMAQRLRDWLKETR